MTLFSLFFPIQEFNRFVFTRKTGKKYSLTLTSTLDLLTASLAIWATYVLSDYEQTEIREELFGPEEDNSKEIRLINNIFYDIENDIFHIDYLFGAITALLWFRCILLLRLTLTFGPMLVMIYRMILVVGTFLIIYLMGLIAFACVATLTLQPLENYKDLYNALLTYFASSIGDFDFE